MMGRAAGHVEVATALIGEECASAGQTLQPHKFNLLSTRAAAEVSVWAPEESNNIPDDKERPAKDEARIAPSGSAMNVLGSIISFKDTASVALAARRQNCWLAYMKIRPQLLHKRMHVSQRAALLDAALLPMSFWGLETVDLTREPRRSIDDLPGQRSGIEGLQKTSSTALAEYVS